MPLRCLPRRSRALLVAVAVAGWLGFSFLLIGRKASSQIDHTGQTVDNGLLYQKQISAKPSIQNLAKHPEGPVQHFSKLSSQNTSFCFNTADILTANPCQRILGGENLKFAFDNFTLNELDNGKRLNEHAVINSNNRTLYNSLQQSGNVNSNIGEVIDLVRKFRNHCFHFDSTPLKSWTTGNASFCSGNFHGFANEFALLRDVIVDKSYCLNSEKGGEQISDVINQEESAEYLQCKSGFIRLSGCNKDEKIIYNFNKADHLNNWVNSIQIGNSFFDSPVQNLNNDRAGAVLNRQKRCRGEFTIATQRFEYVNLYHTMTDWYNVFLTMVFFNRTASETNILLIDGHPLGSLDPVWSRLFKSAILIKELPNEPVLFKNLAWAMIGYNTPMKIFPTPEIPPLYEEFRAFFLSAYSIDPASIHRLDCSQISVQIIYRRDYVAHPRNPSGHVHRQIGNEKQLVKGLLELNPSFKIKGAQVDNYTMEEQIRMVTESDVLIGMHGAGMTHALFLAHNRGAIIELQPSYTTNTGNHYMAIAGWRGLAYERWTNTDIKRELAGHSTVVPAVEINVLLKRVVSKICPNLKS